jgi:hypothetical protein
VDVHYLEIVSEDVDSQVRLYQRLLGLPLALRIRISARLASPLERTAAWWASGSP